jgi:CheY-like chemotaxis protein
MKVLITDDLPLIRTKAKKDLNALGHSSIQVSIEEETLGNVIKRHLDLITVDANIPIMDGLETIKKIVPMSVIR